MLREARGFPQSSSTASLADPSARLVSCHFLSDAFVSGSSTAFRTDRTGGGRGRTGHPQWQATATPRGRLRNASPLPGADPGTRLPSPGRPPFVLERVELLVRLALRWASGSTLHRPPPTLACSRTVHGGGFAGRRELPSPPQLPPDIQSDVRTAPPALLLSHAPSSSRATGPPRAHREPAPPAQAAPPCCPHRPLEDWAVARASFGAPARTCVKPAAERPFTL